MLDISKNTVKTYRKKIEQSGMDIDKLLDIDNPVLYVRLHAGDPANLDARFIHLKSMLDTYIKELTDPKSHATKHILWEEYREVHPHGYDNTQFCYHISQHKKAKKSTRVLDHQPAEMLYVDFAGEFD